MANILVTGGTGQIGTYACLDLAQQGNSVIAFDFKPNPPSPWSLMEKIQTQAGDVLDLKELLNVIKTREVTHVVHLAALLVFESKQNPARAINVNCLGFANVLEASRLSNISRVVFASSVAVYGSPNFYPGNRVSEEDFPHCPNDPYSATKFLNESIGEFYRNTYGLDILCMRVAGAWGPGRYSGYTGQFNDFLRRAASGEQASLPEDFAFSGSKLRWLYVKEMGSCFSYGAVVEKSKAKRGLYNVGSREPFNSGDLVRAITGFLPDAKINFEERDKPTKLSFEIPGPSGLDVDCSRFHDELGYRERLGLKESVKDMINYERKVAGLSSI